MYIKCEKNIVSRVVNVREQCHGACRIKCCKMLFLNVVGANASSHVLTVADSIKEND